MSSKDNLVFPNLGSKTICLTACTFAGSVSVDIDIDIVSATAYIVLNADELSLAHGAVSFTHRHSSKVIKPSTVALFEDDEILVLEFPEAIPIGSGVLHIQFQGTLNDRMKGFYRSTYQHNGEKKNMAVTQFEPADARRCFPCWDEPACKAIRGDERSGEVFAINLFLPNEFEYRFGGFQRWNNLAREVKKSFRDVDNVLHDWTASPSDYCVWREVTCDNVTSHVVALNLSTLNLTAKFHLQQRTLTAS